MKYRAKITIARAGRGNPAALGTVAYLCDKVSCFASEDNGTLFLSEQEAQLVFDEFNKDGRWDMELIPVKD